MPNLNHIDNQPPGTGGSLAYTVRDVQRVAGIGRTRIYELIGSGALRAMKCGGRTLICARSLRAYLDGLPTLPSRTA